MPKPAARPRRREPFKDPAAPDQPTAEPPARLLGLYRLLSRKKSVSHATGAAAAAAAAPAAADDAPVMPRRKTSSTIGRFLPKNPFRKAEPSALSTTSYTAADVSSSPVDEQAPTTGTGTAPRRALSLRSSQPRQRPSVLTIEFNANSAATEDGASTNGSSPDLSATPDVPEADVQAPAAVIAPPILSPVAAVTLKQFHPARRRDLEALHGRSSSLPGSPSIRLPQELYSQFIFGCIFQRASRPEDHEYLTYFCKITDTQLKFYLTDSKGESPVFSILLTELDPPVVKLLESDDNSGAALEKSCSLYSHGDPIADLLGPVNDMQLFLTHLEIGRKTSFDIVCATALLKTTGPTRSLKDDYRIDGDCGLGGYSFVKAATRRRDDQRAILKFLPRHKNRPNDSGLPQEIDVLLSLDSDVIVKVLDVYEGPDYFVMAMERFGDGLDLFEYVSSVDHLTEEQSRRVMRQVVKAVAYLADHRIVHGDIKDENIIIDTETFAIKLIDFGSCRTFAPGQLFETFVGTRHIACPEVAANKAYDPMRQELWSLGVMLYILLTGDYPFETPEDIVRGLLKPVDAELLENISPLCWRLVHGLLDKNPATQLTLEGLQAHPWLQQE